MVLGPRAKVSVLKVSVEVSFFDASFTESSRYTTESILAEPNFKLMFTTSPDLYVVPDSGLKEISSAVLLECLQLNISIESAAAIKSVEWFFISYRVEAKTRPQYDLVCNGYRF